MDVAQQQQQRSQNVQRKAPLHEMTLRGVSISEILYPVLPAELDMLASRGGSAVFCVDRYDKIVISGDVPRCLDHGHAYDIACQKVPIWLRDINHPRKHPSRKKHKSSSPDADVPSADVDTQPQQPVIELGEHANKPRWSIQHMKKRGTLPSTPLLVARLAQRHPEEVCMSLSNVLGSGTLESFRRMDVHVACRPQVCMMPSSAAYEQRQTSAVLPHATMYNTAFSWWAYIRVAARELKNAAPSADAPYATSSSDQCSTKPLTWFTDLLEHAECYVRDMTIKLLNNVYEEECLGVIPTNVLVRVAIELCSPKAWSMCFWWNTAQFSFMLPELSPAEARRISWIAINRDKDEPASDSARPPVGILTPGTTWRAAAIVADEHSFIRELTDAGVAFVSEQMLLEHPRDDPVWQITRADLDAAETLGFVIASQEKLRTINALNYRTESDLSKADVRIVALLPTLHMEAYVAAKLHDIVHERDDTAARLALQQHAARQRPPAVAGTINPTEEQTAAILACLNSRLHVVVGGPGTGKTSVVAKGVANAFPQDCVVFVAATGTAAERLCQCVGMGYTVHSVVAQLEAPRTSGDDAERCTGIDPTKVCVLLVEEASAMPAKMLIALLDKMPAASRVYMFGDDAQMPPPCGGPSVFSAIIALNTHVSRLCQCMRVSHKSDALLHNLTVMRHHVLRGTTGSNSGAPAESASIPMSPAAQLQTIASKCYLNWSSDLQQPHSFYFVAGGSTPAATTGIVRRAMTSIISSTLAENVLADKHPSFQVVTHTNRMVELMLESWAAASLESSANAPPVRINGGSSGILLGVGDRLMFKKNRYGARIITNGMIVTIERIVDGLFDPRLSWHAKVTLGKGSASYGSLHGRKTGDDDVISERAKPPKYALPISYLDAPLTTKQMLASAARAQIRMKLRRGDHSESVYSMQDRVDKLARDTASGTITQIHRYVLAKELNAWVDITQYGRGLVAPAKVATIAKLQGHEVDTIIVVLPENASQSYCSARELYTACSRGKKHCIVVVPDMKDFPPDKTATVLRPCPSETFLRVLTKPDIAQTIAFDIGDTCPWQHFTFILRTMLY